VPQLLSNVRILDLSRMLAGPFGSMLLGDLGAEIIKIEEPAGDFTRTPALGEHSEEILRGLLGYGSRRIQDLTDQKIIIQSVQREQFNHKGG
jgi:crotonobetainyl-CoA:carnitine CoA-transferase CaiB-like acyl-CoA transferase